jgi:hypothetical protein
MSKKIVAASAALLISGISTSPLAACGDQNSNAARGIWRSQGKVGKQEAILIVRDTEVNAALPHMSVVDADLRDAGFAPTWVEPGDLAAKLKEKKWDLIVTGGAQVDLAGVQDRDILLVAMNASKQQKKEAKQKYAYVITEVATNSIVDDVADALEVSVRAAKKQSSNKQTTTKRA